MQDDFEIPIPLDMPLNLPTTFGRYDDVRVDKRCRNPAIPAFIFAMDKKKAIPNEMTRCIASFLPSYSKSWETMGVRLKSFVFPDELNPDIVTRVVNYNGCLECGGSGICYVSDGFSRKCDCQGGDISGPYFEW